MVSEIWCLLGVTRVTGVWKTFDGSPDVVWRMSGQIKSGLVWSSQYRPSTVKKRLGPVRTGQFITGHVTKVKSGQVKIGQVKSGQFQFFLF